MVLRRASVCCVIEQRGRVLHPQTERIVAKSCRCRWCGIGCLLRMQSESRHRQGRQNFEEQGIPPIRYGRSIRRGIAGLERVACNDVSVKLAT